MNSGRRNPQLDRDGAVGVVMAGESTGQFGQPRSVKSNDELKDGTISSLGIRPGRHYKRRKPWCFVRLGPNWRNPVPTSTHRNTSGRPLSVGNKDVRSKPHFHFFSAESRRLCPMKRSGRLQPRLSRQSGQGNNKQGSRKQTAPNFRSG